VTIPQGGWCGWRRRRRMARTAIARLTPGAGPPRCGRPPMAMCKCHRLWRSVPCRCGAHGAAGMCGFSLTQGALRPLGQSGKRFGLLGTCTFGRERLTLSWLWVLGALTWPGRVEHEEEPHECNQRQPVEKKMRHRGHAPSDGSEMRAFYQVFALSELSARLGYTTSQALLLEYLPSSYSTFQEHAVHAVAQKSPCERK
jgi:hypothetical protein